MIVIKLSNDEKYFTDKYTEADGYVLFYTKTKQGKMIKHTLKKEVIAEFIDVPDKELEKELDNEEEDE